MDSFQKQSYKYLDEINEAVLRQFPVNKTGIKGMVLDIGCGSGVLSEAIEKKGYIVWGIDFNAAALEAAGKRITKVINADLTNLAAVKKEIGNKVFDYLVFADILEHVYAPTNILNEYLVFLKKGGYLIVSLPNTVAWSNRIMFLFGRFEYTDTGILDREHIRFFTFKTAKRLVKSSGCAIVKIDYIPYFARVAQPIIKKLLLKNRKPEDINKQELIKSPYYKWYMKYINPIEYFLGYFCKSLFAFKMIIVGKKR